MSYQLGTESIISLMISCDLLNTAGHETYGLHVNSRLASIHLLAVVWTIQALFDKPDAAFYD